MGEAVGLGFQKLAKPHNLPRLGIFYNSTGNKKSRAQALLGLLCYPIRAAISSGTGYLSAMLCKNRIFFRLFLYS